MLFLSQIKQRIFVAEGGENMNQDVLTRKQAMDTLNVKDYRTLNKLIKAGLPVIHAGSYVRFSKSDISEFLEKHKERGGEVSCK